MKRHKYTVEFKQEVLKEAIETNNCTVVARNHELSPNLVAKWVREYKNPVPEGLPLTKETKEMLKENAMLKKLLAEKELENAILQDLLKKTTKR